MKQRSAEALARRAAKRGRTVEEQMALDRGKVKGSAPGKCANTGKRSQPEAPEGGGAAQGAPPAKQQRSTGPGRAGASRAIDRRGSKPQSDLANAWEGSVATPEQIEENRLLRERYKANPSSLTEEEAERAKTLIARDERKRKKKAARKQEQEARAQQNREAHLNRQKSRKQEAKQRSIKEKEKRLTAKYGAERKPSGAEPAEG